MSISNVGWIKLHRNLRNSFSNDKKLNIELWMLYVFLTEQAAWDDYANLNRGQIKIKASEIQREIFPNMSINRVQKLIQHLIKTNHIKSTPVSKISKEGSIIEICQYGYFLPEKAENKVEPNWDPTGTQLGPVNHDKASESLINNHANLGDWNPTGTQLGPNWKGDGCSYYIEERNKEIKEVKEEKTISKDIVQKSEVLESEISKKEKSDSQTVRQIVRQVRQPKKTTKTDVNKAVGYLGAMFKPDGTPETRGFPWPNKQQIEAIASTLVEKYGLDPIKVWFEQANDECLLGKLRWTPSKFDSFVKHFYEVKRNE